DDRLAELLLQPLRGRIRKPGAAANEQRLRGWRPLKRLAAEAIGQLGALPQVGALEMRRLLRLGGAADQLDVPVAQERRELPVDGVIPFVGDDKFADTERLRGVDCIERR